MPVCVSHRILLSFQPCPTCPPNAKDQIMSADHARSPGSAPSPPTADDCRLPARVQTRNVILFGLTVGAYYLAAPVLYVGIVQANLLNELGADDVVANLPSTLYLAMGPVALLAAWYF